MTLVGRGPQQRSLLRHLDHATTPLLLLEGPAGIGKTTLAAWYAEQIRLQGGSAWWVTASAPHLEPALGLWSRLASMVGDACTGTLDYRAARELLRDLAPRPALVVFDDLHAADESSLRLLLHLAPALPDTGVTLVGTLRSAGSHPTETGRQLLSLLHSWSTTVSLPRLDEQDTGDLLRQRVGSAHDDWAQRSTSAMHRWSGGNPLVLRSLIETLDLDPDRLPDLADIDPSVLPRQTSDLVAHRMATLSSSALDVLSVIALADGPVDRSLVEDVLDRSIALDIDLASDAGLLAEQASVLRFSHPAFAEAARHRFTGTSAGLRRRFADALMRQPRRSGDRILILRHLLSSGHLCSADELITAARAAAEEARHLGDAAGEAEAVGVIVRHRSDLTQAAVRADWLRAADALARAGFRQRSWDTAHRVWRASRHVDHDHWAQAAELVGRGRTYDAAAPEIQRLLVTTSDGLAASHPLCSTLLAMAAELAIAPPVPSDQQHGAPLSWRVAPDEARELVARAEGAVASRGAAHDDLVDLAWCAVHRGPEFVDQRRQRCQRLVDSNASPGIRCRAAAHLVVDHLVSGDRRLADDALADMSMLAESCGDPAMQWRVQGLRATVLLAMGRLDDAEHASLRAFEFGERAEEPGRWVLRSAQSLVHAFEGASTSVTVPATLEDYGGDHSLLRA